MKTKTQTQPLELFTIKELSKRYQWLPERRIRYYVDNRARNGLKDTGAVVRERGRLLLIDEYRFLSWLLVREGCLDPVL